MVGYVSLSTKRRRARLYASALQKKAAFNRPSLGGSVVSGLKARSILAYQAPSPVTNLEVGKPNEDSWCIIL